VIPLTVFQLDCPEPPAGWAQLLESENVELVEDDIGRVCINREDAGRLLGALRAEEAFRADERRRREAEREQKMIEAATRFPVPRGVPSHPELGPIEAMLLADEASRPRSLYEQLLDEELAHGKGT
jgi:hypothetical protein